MHWFEGSFLGRKKGRNSVFQALAPGYPYEAGEMQEIVMKTEGRQAMKADVWITRSLPFGMVRSVGKGYEIVLTGHGKNAKSRITAVPAEMRGGR
jgi:hypothetical protein